MILDIVLKVRNPLENEVNYFKENGTLISFLYPVQNKGLVELLAKRHMNVFGMPQTLYFSMTRALSIL